MPNPAPYSFTWPISTPGRILDPVRAAALHEAVELVAHWPEDRLDPERVLWVAERFKEWLAESDG